MPQDCATVILTADETNALVGVIGGIDIVRAILRGERAIRVEPTPETSAVAITALLEEVAGSSVALHAVPRFVAREKFVVDRAGELPISGLGNNFQTNFLDVVEENVEPMTVKQRKLRKRSVDGPILAELGDTDLTKIQKARVALAHVFDYLKTANRSRWFLFYVADAEGRVWAVDAYWNDDGWDVGAHPVSDPYEWGTGDRVVSR